MADQKMLKFFTMMKDGNTRVFDNQEDCDVVFSVEGKTIGAHRLILNVQSKVLYDMAAGWTPDKAPIEIEDMTFDSFRMLLRFMYNGEIPISNETVLTYLSVATTFKMSCLEEFCVDHISESMGKENVCFYMNEAVNFNSTVLQQKCTELFSQKTRDITEHPSFRQLSQPALSALLDAEESNMLEIALFWRIKWWMQQKCKDENLAFTGANMRRVIGDALFKVRFPTMTAQDFGNTVTTIKGLLTNDEIAQIFQKITVLDDKYIECPFPSSFRCQTSSYWRACEDMSYLCNQRVVCENSGDRHCDFGFILKTIRDLGTDKDIGLSVVSLRLALQWLADSANSSGISTPTSNDNQKIRNELYDDFNAWLDVAKTNNVHETMTRYMDLRTKLNKLCEWLN